MSDPGPTPFESTDEPRRIEREIEQLRTQLDGLVDELDRRRHDALDWRAQLRKHPGVLALGAGALLAALALAARRRRSPTLGEQATTFLRGVYAIGEDPERLERAHGRSAPALAAELAKTAALAGASVLVRRLTRRALGEQA